MIPKIILENALILVAEGFWLSSNYSQLRKLSRTRDPRGLFPPTVALNAAGNIAWAAYFALLHLVVPLITNLTMLTITVGILGYLLTDKRLFVKALVSILIIGPIVTFLIIRLPDFSGWTGMIFNMIAATPWLLHVIKTKRTAGLSEVGFYFAFGAMLCTFTYAILISSLPLLMGCVQGLGYTGIIVFYYYRYRQVK